MSRKLDDEQAASFDREYVVNARWDSIVDFIRRDFPSGRFRFIDIGGGNGCFADKLLSHFPHSSAVVLDNSELLLSRNTAHPRKQLLLQSALNLTAVPKRFDLVFCNWVLHHIVADSYSATRDLQRKVLQDMQALLTRNGRLSIFENNYTGHVVDGFPGRMVYFLTSSSLLRPLARRMGANTAGVGVCFLSARQWLHELGSMKFHVVEYREPDRHVWKQPFLVRTGLLIKRQCISHFWLTPVVIEQDQDLSLALGEQPLRMAG